MGLGAQARGDHLCGLRYEPTAGVYGRTGAAAGGGRLCRVDSRSATDSAVLRCPVWPRYRSAVLWYTVWVFGNPAAGASAPAASDYGSYRSTVLPGHCCHRLLITARAASVNFNVVSYSFAGGVSVSLSSSRIPTPFC